MNMVHEMHELLCNPRWQATPPGQSSSGAAKSMPDQGLAGRRRHLNACRQVYQIREAVGQRLIRLPYQYQSSLQSP
jgi:hypothetical protein